MIYPPLALDMERDTTLVPRSSALVFVARDPVTDVDHDAIAGLLDRHAGVRLVVVRLPSAARLEFPFASSVIDLPLEPAQADVALAIGMQIGLNEGSDCVGAIRTLAAPDLDVASACLRALQERPVDAIFLATEDPAKDAVFVTGRAAFAVSFWGALADGLAPQRQDILATLLGLAGRRVLRHVPHQTGSRFEPFAGDGMAKLAPHAEQLGRKLGLMVNMARKPVAARVRRVAVVTPYYREPDSELQRCMASVRGQTMACDHIVVSDGFPNPLVERFGATHVKLGQPHRDNGNTPRYVGGLIAFARGYDGVAYLDADNWYHPRHVELLVRKQHETCATAVCSAQNIYLANGTKLPDIDDEDRRLRHVDTSCLMITRSCEFIAHLWGQMPQRWGPVCDRVVFSALNGQSLAWTENRTLNFKSNYSRHYVDANQPVPETVHDIPAAHWKSFALQDPAFKELSRSRTGRVMGIYMSQVSRDLLTGKAQAPR